MLLPNRRRGNVSGETLLYARHSPLFQLGLAALSALEHRQRLEDHDGGVSGFEREIRDLGQDRSTANATPHPYRLFVYRKGQAQIDNISVSRNIVHILLP